ncbi:MAG: nucleotidyltransferase domain-containing protein [Actinomycetota bacterium]
MDHSGILKENAEELANACRRHRVHRLTLFGSAAVGAFDPATSDFDLLVEFEPMSSSDRANHFFGLQEDLEELLGAPVDLVEPSAIRNPYFTRAIEPTLRVLYEAA